LENICKRYRYTTYLITEEINKDLYGKMTRKGMKNPFTILK
jgi:hypothetical protein